MKDKSGGRRQFLKGSAALGLSAGIIPAVQSQETRNRLALSAYGERSTYVKTQRISDGGSNCSFGSDCNTLTPLQDLVGIITPSALHFNGSHGAYPPDINPDEHKLMIHGMVDRPLSFSMAELKRMPFISRIHFIECEANYPLQADMTVQHTHGKTSCSEWTGVPLSLLLKEVGVKSGAKWIVAEGADRDLHSKSLPMVRALNDAFIAYGQNGEPLRPHQGFPIRLMVPGYGGFSHVKWLRRIMLTDKPHLTPSERFEVQFGPKSVITAPSGGQQLTDKGFYSISGLAWSGAGAISSVEVSTDGGGHWQKAIIHGPALPIAHTRFSMDWNWNGKEATIMSRCTDDKGQVQPTAAELAKSAGVTIDQVLTRDYQQPGQWHVVFPWKIASDGSVRHALWT